MKNVHRITSLVSLIGVRVGFDQTIYSEIEEDANGEGSEVEVCINLFGTPGRDVVVSIFTTNGTATGNNQVPVHLSLCSSSELSIMTITGGADYEEVLAVLTTVELTFGRTKRQTDTPGPLTETECIPLSFLSDDLVEDDETFTVHLVSDDPLVTLYPAWADVVIINNDREFQM